MRCKHCGAEMSDYHVFCTKCGQPLDMYGGGSASPQPASEPKPVYPQEPAYSHDPAPEPYAAPDPKPYSDPEPYADPRPAPKPRKQRTGREPLLIAALALAAAAVVVLVIVLASGGRSRPTPQRPQSAVVTQQPLQTQQPVATPTPDPEYLLPDSDSRLLTETDLDPLTWEELCLARNEIFARHGRKFTTPEIDRYFSEKSWYHGTISPADFSDSLLSETERANIQTIIAYEEKHYGGSYY